MTHPILGAWRKPQIVELDPADFKERKVYKDYSKRSRSLIVMMMAADWKLSAKRSQSMRLSPSLMASRKRLWSLKI
jgi:hypothetical protein